MIHTTFAKSRPHCEENTQAAKLENYKGSRLSKLMPDELPQFTEKLPNFPNIHSDLFQCS
ncbi:hypothetical protein ABD07_14250 [Nitrosomonas oligotropha]|nr:hypothetical protein [Nitrosomonas oligotropha]